MTFLGLPFAMAVVTVVIAIDVGPPFNGAIDALSQIETIPESEPESNTGNNPSSRTIRR
jgi:hypothetical protein